ncbi:hypothetical protein CsSME_00006378 [Camellia sinensis var. sinensis]
MAGRSVERRSYPFVLLEWTINSLAEWPVTLKSWVLMKKKQMIGTSMAKVLKIDRNRYTLALLIVSVVTITRYSPYSSVMVIQALMAITVT